MERKLGPHSPHGNNKALPSPQNGAQVRARSPQTLVFTEHSTKKQTIKYFKSLLMTSLCLYVQLVLQENSRAPGSPTSLRVPPNGGCEDLDMETEEEDELRARGQIIAAQTRDVDCLCSGRKCLVTSSGCSHQDQLHDPGTHR